MGSSVSDIRNPMESSAKCPSLRWGKWASLCRSLAATTAMAVAAAQLASKALADMAAALQAQEQKAQTDADQAAQQMAQLKVLIDNLQLWQARIQKIAIQESFSAVKRSYGRPAIQFRLDRCCSVCLLPRIEMKCAVEQASSSALASAKHSIVQLKSDVAALRSSSVPTSPTPVHLATPHHFSGRMPSAPIAAPGVASLCEKLGTKWPSSDTTECSSVTQDQPAASEARVHAVVTGADGARGGTGTESAGDAPSEAPARQQQWRSGEAAPSDARLFEAARQRHSELRAANERQRNEGSFVLDVKVRLSNEPAQHGSLEEYMLTFVCEPTE
eukprot:1878140-Pleurochrysis_carterae.AAC.1